MIFLSVMLHLSPRSLPGYLQEAKVKITQLCLILCDLMDYAVHRILQARIMEWVAIPFSRGSSQPRDQTPVSHLAGGFFTESQRKPKNPGVSSLSLLQRTFPTQESNKLRSPALQVDSLPIELSGKPLNSSNVTF